MTGLKCLGHGRGTTPFPPPPHTEHTPHLMIRTRFGLSVHEGTGAGWLNLPPAILEWWIIQAVAT